MPVQPATPAPGTADWLVQELTSARVAEAVQLRPYVQEFRASGGGAVAPALAEFLVRTGLLTPFQADRALTGQAGKLVLGPYLLSEILGTGNLGTVFQAVGRSDRLRYAVKVLPLRSLWNVHLAKNQVRVFAELPPHPAVVPFVDVGTAGGSHYLAWQFAEGVTLAATVARSGRLAVGEAVRVLTHVADCLALCHAHGIVHGLLKPSNVLLGADGQPRILDLGVGAILSENIADDESMLDTISTANAALGMLDCCAPETLTDPTRRTPAGDVYSLGCVGYYLLTGALPFPGGTAVEKVIAHQTAEPTPPDRLNPELPGWLGDLIRAMMRKDPAARPGGMADVLAALKAGAGALPVAGGRPRPVPSPATSQTPMLTAPDPRPDPPRPVKPKSLIDFDLPDEQVTDPGFVLDDAPSGTTGEPTDYNLALPDPPPRVPGPPRPVPGPFRPAGSPGPAAPAVSPPVVIPPPPRASTSLLRRLKKKVMFWLPPTDVVQLSVFGPPSVAPGANILLQVFAHTPGAFESVRTLSRAFHQDGELLAAGFVTLEVVRGGELGLHLAVANARVGRSLHQLNWLGQPQPRSFEVHVPWESPVGQTVGILSAGLDGLLAGRVEFRILILPRRA